MADQQQKIKKLLQNPVLNNPPPAKAVKLTAAQLGAQRRQAAINRGAEARAPAIKRGQEARKKARK